MPSQKTMVKTKVSTRTKVIVAAFAIFAFGLAAYGFGLMPGVQQEEVTLASCSDVCNEQFNSCVANGTDYLECKLGFSDCYNQCQAPSGYEPTGYEPTGYQPGGRTAPTGYEPVGYQPTGYEPTAYGTSPAGPESCDLTVENMPVLESPPSASIEPQPRPLVGGDVWRMMARFTAHASGDDVRADRFRIASYGDAANFTQVAIASNGAVVGYDVLPSGQNQQKDVVLSAPVTFPKDAYVTFDVWGKLANVVSSSSVNGATEGVARSGNLMRLGLAKEMTTGEWDANYSDKYNVHSVCGFSGRTVYASSVGAESHGYSPVGSVLGPWYSLHRSKPTVAIVALPLTTLVAGQDMDIFKFRVSADAAGAVALKKFTLSLMRSPVAGSSLNLGGFHLRKGSRDIPWGDYGVWLNGDQDLKNGTMGTTGSGEVTVSLKGEEMISGAGNVYTIHAKVMGPVVSGDKVRVNFMNEEGEGPYYAGYLSGYGATGSRNGIAGPNISFSSAPLGSTNSAISFVWSDLSEVPHSAADGLTGGSRDWLTGQGLGFTGWELGASPIELTR